MPIIPKDSPEGKVLSLIWRTMIGLSGPIAEQYRWVLTGIAAVLAVIIGNLNSISAVIHDLHLKIAICMLVASVFLTAIAYFLSAAVKFRSDVVSELERALAAPDIRDIIGQIRITPQALNEEMAKPFFGPLGILMRGAAKRGAADPLSTDKGSIRLMVWQAYAMWSGMLLASVSLVTLAIGIK